MYTSLGLLLDPFVLFWLLLATSFIFRFRKKERLANLFLFLGIFWMFIVGVSPFSQWMVSELEDDYAVFQPAKIQGDSSVHILVLGGGHSIAPDLPPGSQLTWSALQRLAEGIRLYRQIPRSKLVCSGYSASKRTTQAEMLANAAVDLGVDVQDTIQSRSPKNTAEEIRAYKNRFGTSTTLIVVTSGYHMPRAMLLCEKEGLKAMPAPTDFYIKKDPLRSNFDFYPYPVKITMLEAPFTSMLEY